MSGARGEGLPGSRAYQFAQVRRTAHRPEDLTHRLAHQLRDDEANI